MLGGFGFARNLNKPTTFGAAAVVLAQKAKGDGDKASDSAKSGSKEGGKVNDANGGNGDAGKNHSSIDDGDISTLKVSKNEDSSLSPMNSWFVLNGRPDFRPSASRTAGSKRSRSVEKKKLKRKRRRMERYSYNSTSSEKDQEIEEEEEDEDEDEDSYDCKCMSPKMSKDPCR